MINFLLALTFMIPFTSFARPQRLSDNIFITSNTCSVVRTDITTGEQTMRSIPTVSFGCKRNEGLSLTCSLLVEEGIISSFEMKGGVEDNVAILTGDHEQITLQGVNEGFGQFKSESNLAFLDDQNFSDTRVCEGIWSTATIMNTWVQEEAAKTKRK